MSSHFRKAEREKIEGTARIKRVSGRDGNQIVRSWDVSKLGFSFESLSQSPYTVGEKILVIEVNGKEKDVMSM